MDKFKNKFRCASARLPEWNYGSNAAYFVTICTKNRERFFGTINNGVMQLSPIGIIANQFWLEIPHHFAFAKLGAHIIMPDHMHGIVIIDKPKYLVGEETVGTAKLDGEMVGTPKLDGEMVGTPKLDGEMVGTPKLDVPTISPSRTSSAIQKWKPGILGVIVNQYKRICTIHARKLNPDFAWQSRFYDHIIRDEKSFASITKYILNNPETWNG